MVHRFSSIMQISLVCLLTFFHKDLLAQTLRESVQNALANDHLLQGEFFAYKSSVLNLGSAVARFLPSISVIVNETLFQERYNNPRNNSGLNIRIDQTLYQGSLFVSDLKSKKHTQELTKTQYNQKVYDVVLSAVNAHTNYIQRKKILSLYDKNITLMKDQFEIANAKYNLGEMTKVELLSSQAKLRQAISDRSQAYGNYINAQTEYLRVTGVQPKNLTIVASDNPTPPKSLTDLLQKAEHNNLTIKKSQLNQKIAYYNKQSYVATMHPKLSLFSNVPIGDSSVKGYESTSEMGLSFNYPLFNGGANISNFLSQSALYKKSIEQHKDTLKQIESRIISLWNKYKTDVESEKAANSLLDARTQELDIIIKEFELRLKTSHNVLEASLDKLNAEIAYVQRKHDKYITLYNITFEIGDVRFMPFNDIISQYII
ncbi:MAG: outer membrane efflux family protein [Candidatus Xenolissoclinum pacificiensis L6]|uniref:Outer membrane efflux family protein n=1 Tax=Candidatus Xenolissoclinum pacificiensis L6 TaxID=1401685 RepID=W2UZN9_9RICK|nr:MAG: outer membrane efflux family protein [Candidatus Xenolissoclinum pacificiensis L6]